MKNRILNYLLRHLFNAMTVADIISTDPKTKEIVIDGQKIRPDELRALQAEIKAFKESRIWKLLHETTKYTAEQQIFINSVTPTDIVFGKAMLYNLSLQKSIMHVLENKTL